MAASPSQFFGLTTGARRPAHHRRRPPPATPPHHAADHPARLRACRVTATVNAWNNGLTENLTITNTGTAAINGWSLVFTLPGGQTITSGLERRLLAVDRAR